MTAQTSHTADALSGKSPSLAEQLSRFKRWQAYRNKAAEWVLVFLFVSGVLLWETLPISWPVFRWSLLLHSIAGLLLFPLTTALFWWAHRGLLERSNKPFLRLTGQILDWLLALCGLSGIVLLFWGAAGNQIGELTSDLHWITGLLLGPLTLRHAWRYSALRALSPFKLFNKDH